MLFIKQTEGEAARNAEGHHISAFGYCVSIHPEFSVSDLGSSGFRFNPVVAASSAEQILRWPRLESQPASDFILPGGFTSSDIDWDYNKVRQREKE